MGGCLSIRIRENVMKCINVKCEGKPAYDIVIESGFGGLSESGMHEIGKAILYCDRQQCRSFICGTGKE